MKIRRVEISPDEHFGFDSETGEKTYTETSTGNNTSLIIGGVIVLGIIVLVYYQSQKKYQRMNNDLSDMKNYFATFPMVTKEFDTEHKAAENNWI